MITIKEAEEILKKEYHIDNFLYVVNDMLLPDFVLDRHEVEFKNNIFESVNQLGYSDKCEVTVFEVILKTGSHNRRVTITQEMFKILRGLGINNAIVAFANADKLNYRFSLLTSKYEFNGEKVVKVLSNPRMYSYSLGYGTKTKTAYDFLIGKGKVNSLDELINRFSVEVVNKQFYSEIAACFTRLVGGQRDGKTFNRELNIYGVTDQNKYAEFAVRLIGRIVFCWFLKEKKSENGLSLIPETLLHTKDIKIAGNYYHDVLEPLFFELLNTSIPRRKGKFAQEVIYNQIPYLNGGLFSPHIDDHYKFSPELQSGQYGLVTIPNDWFDRFYAVLGQYNFTVDENTSYDIELSIDPEMLGRIFENLLAEINPETGENAKKSTGSFYTPRDIVDYMVDNSILEYIKTKTGLDETRLKALISYSKEDDDIASFTNSEKKAIISALYTVTVLDPACGSGAFPIGMLQKIVYMLQEIDPEANLWFDEIVKGAPIYVRKAFEEKFSNGELDYIRKLTVIEKSIYGVDIQPIAVEIARLRCFLSLVIEQKVNDTLPNRGVHPLPSLDFKFLIANSLVKLPDDSSNHMGMKVDQLNIFENVSHIDELKAVREEYFNADNERKSELREEFADIQKRMFQQTLSMAKNASPRYSALSNWSPFKNEPTDWFDAEWMFGVKDGFDIVIANPPYGANIDSRLEQYRKTYIKTNKNYAEIYKMFFEFGFNALKENGHLCYITPNTYLSQPRYKDLRMFLLGTRLMEIINLGEGVFKEVVVPVCISLLAKEKAEPTYTLRDLRIKSSFQGDFSSARVNEVLLETILKTKDLNLYQLDDNKNCLNFDDVFCIKDAGIQYHRSNIGLKNKGGNDLFERIVSDIPTGFDLTRPIFYGKLINRYYMEQSTDEYFNLNYKKVLKSNESVSFSKVAFNIVPKILWRQTASFLRATLDENKVWFRNTIQCAWIKEEYVKSISIKSALAIFNSKYIRFLYNKLVQEAGRVFPQIKITHVKKLPIVIPQLDWQKEVDSLVDKMLHEDYSETTDNLIDEKVYELYGLTPEEIALVEESVK